jgi:hypothetical protein
LFEREIQPLNLKGEHKTPLLDFVHCCLRFKEENLFSEICSISFVRLTGHEEVRPSLSSYTLRFVEEIEEISET